ncbi:MAG: glycoside hydrolase family 16 protein [Jatrophihabitans sp.]|uniref:glycoside hydrolase family 16 protein n=1 Tax=Jatrophihabitans sp. TaxID=1932789 RepID=UPI003F7E7B83
MRRSLAQRPRRRAALLALVVGVVASVVSVLPGSAGAARFVATQSAGSCGGTVLVKADGTPWTCSFDDEFDGTALDRHKWLVQTTSSYGYHSGAECFVDSPSNVSVSNGVLNLTARRVSQPFTCPAPGLPYTTQYTSGMVDTAGLFAQAYGRFEFRAKVPAAAVAGLQTSLWLYPVNGTKYGSWPASGEIDVAETYSQYPNLAVPYIHYNSLLGDPNATNTNCTIDAGQFHTYTLVWTTQTLTVSIDGQTCVSDNWNPFLLAKPAPFDQPFMVLLTQALGIGTNAFDPATTPLPATTQVDYVRVWR